MSFILKALKKVEEEKAARQGEVDLPSALLRADAPPAHGASRLSRWGIIVLVFAAGSGLTTLLVQNRPVASAPVRDQAAPVTPPPPVPPSAHPSAGTETVAPVATAVAEPPVKPGAHRQQLPPETRAAAAEPADNPAPLPPAGSAPPGLRVNGIALQDDPAESVAVVNGALVKRGMTVGGMRVEEILPDRVRFSGPGGTVEVHMSR
ncbi:MAG TPA: hypothetical protein VI298_18115 [Geobacteraceae bacterium]